MKSLPNTKRPPYRFWFPDRSPCRSRCTRQTCVSHQPSRSWWAWQTRLSRTSHLTLLTSLPWFPCWPFLAEIPPQCEQYSKKIGGWRAVMNAGSWTYLSFQPHWPSGALLIKITSIKPKTVNSSHSCREAAQQCSYFNNTSALMHQNHQWQTNV